MAKETLTKAQLLRQKAEAIVSAYPVDLNESFSPEKTAQIVHELQVHQIELEMQNDELRSVHNELIEQKERYFDLYDLAPVGYVTLSKEWQIIEANLTASSLLGSGRNQLIHQPFSRYIYAEDQDNFYLCRQKFLETRIKHSCDIRLLRKGANYFWALIIVDSDNHDDSGGARIRMAISDITDKKSYEDRLYRIGQYDSLTNLPNRLLLSDRLHQAMGQALRYERKLAVIYLDLDGFKEINDTYGHDIGDQVLIMLAEKMHNILREGDTIARLGGDEFVALLLNLGRIEEAIPMLKRFLDITNEPLEIETHILQVSASLGVTFFPQAENVDADLLLRQADQAMYQAKISGRNRYHTFDIQQDSVLRERYELIEIIRYAIQTHQFILYYQPKVNMKTGAVIGTEALIRWNHPSRGLLEPSSFLPIIEGTSLCVEMGEWVIDATLTQIELWQSEGLSIEVSVNIGAQQLQEDNFLQRLQEILEQHPKVSPSCLTLEILETSKIENLHRTTEIIQACRAFGILFSLDDFGTGYSSLTYLQRLPISTIKIDQSFIRDMLNNVDDITILSGIISLGKAFHLDIIAEGVETMEHGELLLSMGCELAQGYAIAHPMPPDEFVRWFATWQPYPSWREISKK
ncbi:MAG: EAL domain-containing protein [Sulfuricurvum sp.]|uniref:putative bifunctional diguanylate cyclase/phosphodiesterase n=1 Tax=Sulfuricurvum sp. TaxID=2025608 RepID=UPI00262FD290|nr:EAL domain-containing protein [Sulfuricurvum sp.]MDD2828804.1 EAL domain-containing protein [Sulfuricurvum sp.]MDD4948737.1 EAL domain-containing protein [Sulfuricurvum sp.]